MASERMRMLIRKFEPSSDDISSRYLATPASPEVPQTAARATFEHDPMDFHSSPPPVSHLGSSEMPQTAARALFEHDPTDFIFIPPPVSHWSGLGCPGELRNAPDCSQSYFWARYYGFIHSFIPPPCFSLSASRFKPILKTTSKQYSVFCFSSVIFI